jgi:hypothetical protein
VGGGARAQVRYTRANLPEPGPCYGSAGDDPAFRAGDCERGGVLVPCSWMASSAMCW